MIHDYKALLNILLPKIPPTHQVYKLGTIADLDMLLIMPKEMSPAKPNILVVSGTHGEEIGGPWGLVRFIVNGGLSKYPNLNISVIPVVNPDAFNRGTRYDRWHGISNQGFDNSVVPSKEVKILKTHSKLMLQIAKDGFLSLHESDNTDRRTANDHEKMPTISGYYMYMMSKQVDATLRDAMVSAAQPIGVLPEGEYWSKFEKTYKVEKGCVHNLIDDSFDHYLYENGVPMCITSETPSDVDLSLRIQANARITEVFMGIAAEGGTRDWASTFTNRDVEKSAAKKYKFDDLSAWGFCASISLTNCDAKIVRDPLAITMYVEKLIQTIGGKAYGAPTLYRFGEDNKYGYTFIQLLTTSSVTGHFAEDSNSVFIDIFYCKSYDPDLAIRFTHDYFGGEMTKVLVFTR